MTWPPATDSILAHNQVALAELQRAITLRPDRFSLILARCNYARLQATLVDYLVATMAMHEVRLAPHTHNLRQVLTQPPNPTGAALMVTGLASVPALEPLLRATNLGRDEFPKTLPCPVVLWVNDPTLAQINRHAPDFKSFAATPILFDYPPQALVRLLHQNADELFATMLSLGDDSPYPDQTPLYQPGSTLRTELTFALADLAAAQTPLDDELQASLNFLQGRDALGQGNRDLARYYFDQSLTYWRTQAEKTSQSARPKQAILLFYLGVTWRSWAATQRVVYRQLLTKAQDSFTACLAIFRADGQPDLVGKFLHALAEVKQKLEDWPGLAAIAQEGLTLHRRDAVRLARDHGYLAEVALAHDQLAQAQQEAETALEILKIAGAVVGRDPASSPSWSGEGVTVADHYQRGWYLYLLAQVRLRQNQVAVAIDLLQQAQAATQPQLDLTLYRQILTTLRQQYYAQKDYRAAFAVKRQQRQVETQFKLRAFIGASPVRPYALAPLLRSSRPVPLAAEIEASGRWQDVEALTLRLAQPRYPLITLHGPSGVGKSSILYGGLIPALSKSFPEGRATLPLVITTYRDWPTSLDQAIEAAFQGWPPLGEDRDQPDRSTAPAAIAPILATLPLTADGSALLARLQHLIEQRYLQVVLICDQFEDLFAEVPTLPQRQDFYAFLVACLNAPYIKLLLALREDYLHHLLELERGFDLDILNNDILSRDYRYYLGNFQPQDAKGLIRQLTRAAQIYLDEALMDQLVQDLTTAGQVRPIELQVVGAQLQRDEITTLAAYQQLGEHPKETLVRRFLDAVIEDCGHENALLARGILYLLTDVDHDQRPYRPAKSQVDLEEELRLRGTVYSLGQLTLVLEVLVESGLVFLMPDVPLDRYQLVHEYLVNYVRQPELVAALGWRP